MSTRDFSIKTGVLKRVAKEQVYYHAERDKQQKRINDMIAKDPNDYEIKKQREVLEETLDMLPDVERRKKAAHQDLANLVANANPDIKSSKEYQEAVETLEQYE
ncbi:hypothetical protein BX616_010096 [Lobosporangium transversale]|uniref:Tubulin-specific chaperone A n=1 Tax=Lobosporangium transversale TaxID=64571 RepID=A0A1Y2GHS2_9FUNG|nr:tubulin binding cofactor A [Lobosporangium transversale]KAF9913386.1 hypothetical protein BX616_010096 [Lobosporangium transversale]ORZ11287.1 tubulin binding cofactor A [Lobosporangium transversale]|eukprot:XP_021879602.1 tubulin binding cofactor A [Lobosporangium transversale]